MRVLLSLARQGPGFGEETTVVKANPIRLLWSDHAPMWNAASHSSLDSSLSAKTVKALDRSSLRPGAFAFVSTCCGWASPYFL